MRNERGMVLVLSLFVMTLLTIMGLAFLTTTMMEHREAVNFREHAAAFYAAEGGLESGAVNLKSLLAVTPQPTQPQLDTVVPAAMSDARYQFTEFTVTRGSAFDAPGSITKGPYIGMNADITKYVITATATGPYGARSRQREWVEYQKIPLFQFGVFYGRGVDLEIAPGPPMTFNGRVHANGDLYITNDSMRFDSYVTTAGKVYRYLKRDPSNRGTNPQIKDGSGNYQGLNFDHEYNYDFTNAWAPADWSGAARNKFSGNLQDSAMGVGEIIPPVPAAVYDPANPDISAHQIIEVGNAADSQELKDAKLYYQAGLRFKNNQAYDQSGLTVDLSGCTSPVVQTKTFHDAREGKTMVTTEFDVQALQDCGKVPANGIVYLDRKDGVSEKGAVRIVNGATLPAGGLTIASGDPVYVQGDFNTSANHPPAAIMGDAITALSANWDDANGNGLTSSRPATPTTINAALMLGPSAESVNGQGNGQLENLIRFLEDWKGVDFQYSGSIVALWHSLDVTADWRCCGDSGSNYYNPPNRIWSYDGTFDNQVAPGAPYGLVITTGQWQEF